MNRTLGHYAVIITLLLVSFASLQAQWVKVGPNGGFGRLDTDPSGFYLYAQVSTGTIRSSDLGQDWEPLSTGNAILAFLGGGEMIAGTQAGTIWRSSNYGGSWDSLSNPLPRSGISALCYNNGLLFAGTPGLGIFLSTDSGSNWVPINKGIYGMVDSEVTWTVTALAVAGGYLFAGTGDPLEGGIGIIRSKVGTYVWDSIPTYIEETIVTGFSAIGPFIFASTAFSDGGGGYGVYQSTDSGATWQNAGFPIPYRSVMSMIYSSPYLITGHHDFGVFVSSDSGHSWVPSSGLPETYPPSYSEVDVAGLAVERGYLFAGITYGDSEGLYRRPLSDLQGGDYIRPVPRPSVAPGILEICDVLGRSVYHGPAASKPALAPGFYFEQQGSTVSKIWVR